MFIIQFKETLNKQGSQKSSNFFITIKYRKSVFWINSKHAFSLLTRFIKFISDFHHNADRDHLVIEPVILGK